MDQHHQASLYPGVAQKADAIIGAIGNGHRRIAAIAKATHLSESTVIRVAALLRDRGLIGVIQGREIELVGAAPH